MAVKARDRKRRGEGPKNCPIWNKNPGTEKERGGEGPNNCTKWKENPGTVKGGQITVPIAGLFRDRKRGGGGQRTVPNGRKIQGQKKREGQRTTPNGKKIPVAEKRKGQRTVPNGKKIQGQKKNSKSQMAICIRNKRKQKKIFPNGEKKHQEIKVALRVLKKS